MVGPYTVQQNEKDRGWDVVRSVPTVIATELKLGEAEALAFALNTQARILEGRLK
jgi:predicted nucleic acid-binding protein